VLLKQRYSHEDDLAHIESLIPAFKDPRYIRIDDKPLFLVYRAEYLPDPIRTTNIWREAAAKVGIGDLFLARVESHESFRRPVAPQSIGFDAEVEFAPFSCSMGKLMFHTPSYSLLSKMGLVSKGYIENRVTRYDAMVYAMLNRQDSEGTRFRCVTPSWDNSARKKDALIYHGSTPEKYEAWLRKVVGKTLREHRHSKRIVFINAWNEWAEGNHLEPDLEWGRAYLEATRRALDAASEPSETPVATVGQQTETRHPLPRRLYWSAARIGRDLVQQMRSLVFRGK
jgi:lipopolysaccharide biosynthesis protein